MESIFGFSQRKRIVVNCHTQSLVVKKRKKLKLDFCLRRGKKRFIVSWNNRAGFLFGCQIENDSEAAIMNKLGKIRFFEELNLALLVLPVCFDGYLRIAFLSVCHFVESVSRLPNWNRWVNFHVYAFSSTGLAFMKESSLALEKASWFFSSVIRTERASFDAVVITSLSHSDILLGEDEMENVFVATLASPTFVFRPTPLKSCHRREKKTPLRSGWCCWSKHTQRGRRLCKRPAAIISPNLR